MENKILKYLVVICAIASVLLIWFRKPSQVYKYQTVNKIEKGIEQKKDRLDSVVVKTETVRKELTYFKSVFDTVRIVQYQDSVITYQDTQIVVLNQIVKSQDTVIDLLKFDNKRIKRQRNWLIVGTAVLGSILILK